MKKIAGIVSLAVTLFALFTLPAHAAWVIVDAGHTPGRPGATAANGRVEHEYNLDLSAVVARDLEARGDTVTRTGAGRQEIGLADRPNAAPDANLFVSIHHDSLQQAWIDTGHARDYRGFAVFVSAKNPFYEQSLACARQIAARLVAAGETPSLYHATPIQGENRPLIDRGLGIHRFDDLVVLRTAPMPAVLVEAGVIVNPDEAVRLQDGRVVGGLGKAISDGILECGR
ncbi:N-acetylmuramoyl-L-alanine amidase family protein [Paraburkholderia sp. SIMBA_054]|uniref:N-acetylmuramoyl-L-alanine amidase family protein n=1 Tax=Paraburkholderia sp. SIMBA_054 TaxID=3085795 RepID=UPI00397C101F